MMELKKFEAPTLSEALQVVKRELGPEAIVLSTKTKKSAFGLLNRASVEVTAAIHPEALERRKIAEQNMTEEQKKALQKAPAQKVIQAYDVLSGARLSRQMSTVSPKNVNSFSGETLTERPNSLTQRKYIDIQDDDSPAEVATARSADRVQLRSTAASSGVRSLSADVGSPRGISSRISSHSASSNSLSATPAKNRAPQQGLAGLISELMENGVEEDLVRELGDELKIIMVREHITRPDILRLQLSRLLMAKIRVARPLTERLRVPGTPRIVAFVGPTGVGKTTTVAKIAAELVLNQRRPVVLATADTFKIAAVEQLQTYANILKIPLEVCPTAESLEKLNLQVGPEEVILLDTGGFGPKDEKKLYELRDLLATVRSETHLCVAATTKDRDLMMTIKRFKMFELGYLVMTKIDESSAHGNLLNLAARSQLPFSYFTMGQRVPEDIEVASKERVADLILNLAGRE